MRGRDVDHIDTTGLDQCPVVPVGSGDPMFAGELPRPVRITRRHRHQFSLGHEGELPGNSVGDTPSPDDSPPNALHGVRLLWTPGG